MIFHRPILLARNLLANRERPDLEALARVEDPERFVWEILPHAGSFHQGWGSRRAKSQEIGDFGAALFLPFQAAEQSRSAHAHYAGADDDFSPLAAVRLAAVRDDRVRDDERELARRSDA